VFSALTDHSTCSSHVIPQLRSSFPKLTHSTFWNRIRWTKKNTFPKLTQSTEHDSKKWNEWVLEMSSSIWQSFTWEALAQWSGRYLSLISNFGQSLFSGKQEPVIHVAFCSTVCVCMSVCVREQLKHELKPETQSWLVHECYDSQGAGFWNA